MGRPRVGPKGPSAPAGDALVTIGSGGCNTFSLLLEDPGRIFAVDINPCQSHLLELKRAAIRRLDFDDLHAFLGLNPSAMRWDVFESLSADLSPPALAYWRSRPAAVRSGIVYQGRYEKFLRYFRGLLHLTQGRKRIDGLFRCQALEEQQDYFDRVWNTAQWRMLFHLLFNKRVLARRGLSADYFRFDDGSSSFAQVFSNVPGERSARFPSLRIISSPSICWEGTRIQMRLRTGCGKKTCRWSGRASTGSRSSPRISRSGWRGARMVP